VVDAIISQIYFWNRTLHVSDSSSVHHRASFHCSHVDGICHTGLLTASEQDQDGTGFILPDPARKLSAHITFLCVQWKTPDDGRRNCLKHVEFYSKNKFEKLVHLVGFIVRMVGCLCAHVEGKWENGGNFPLAPSHGTKCS